MSRMAIDERRKQLITSAIAVMTAEGIAAATTRRIAQHAGVAVGVVHYCFGSKEALYRQVVTQLVADVRDVAVARFEPMADLRAALSRATEAFLGDVEDRPGQHLLTYEILTYSLRHEGWADVGRWLLECYDVAQRELLERFASSAGVRWSVPIDVVARMFVGLNDGLVLAQLVDRDGHRAREVFALVIDQVLLLTERVDAVIDAGATRA